MGIEVRGSSVNEGKWGGVGVRELRGNYGRESMWIRWSRGNKKRKIREVRGSEERGSRWSKYKWGEVGKMIKNEGE